MQTIFKYKNVEAMRFIKAIKKRLPVFRHDKQDFGTYIALTNMFWPIIARLPKPVFKIIMRRKNKQVLHFLNANLYSVIDKYKDVKGIEQYDKKAPIWVCWLQGENQLPALCRKCVDSIIAHSNGHPVILISFENYSDFVEIPIIILNKYKAGLIGQAHFSDILRTALLAEKGGCWLDATILVTRNIEEEIFRHPIYSCKFQPDHKYITQNMWSNFFLVAQKGAVTFRFVRDMLYEYLQRNSRFIDYFMMDYIIRIGYDNIDYIKEEIDAIPLNNTGVHDLKRMLKKEMTKDFLQKLFADTYIHKLDWRQVASKYDFQTIGYNLFQDEKSLLH